MRGHHIACLCNVCCQQRQQLLSPDLHSGQFWQTFTVTVEFILEKSHRHTSKTRRSSINIETLSKDTSALMTNSSEWL